MNRLMYLKNEFIQRKFNKKMSSNNVFFLILILILKIFNIDMPIFL